MNKEMNRKAFRLSQVAAFGIIARLIGFQPR